MFFSSAMLSKFIKVVVCNNVEHFFKKNFQNNLSYLINVNDKGLRNHKALNALQCYVIYILQRDIYYAAIGAAFKYNI